MFKEFQFTYGKIDEINVKNPNELISSITSTASDVIMTTIHNTMSLYQTTDKQKTYTLLGTEPAWLTVKAKNIEIFEVIPPQSVEAIFQRLSVGVGKGVMKIAKNPFAQGSLRYAYYGQLEPIGSPTAKVVYKELINADPQYNTLQVYLQHLEIHTIAQFLATKFNEKQRSVFSHPLEVLYADASLVRRIGIRTKIYQVEPRLYQRIQKWNNNSGGVSFKDYSSILQSFSHWTYQYTAKRLMVVDLQGVKTHDNTYLLTDPAIHFLDIKRYCEARTNLGVKGMREFFRTHTCTPVCEKLGLLKVENSINEHIFKQICTSNTDESFLTACNINEDEEGCSTVVRDIDHETLHSDFDFLDTYK
ncbi:unnamed protein product [Didymodactylos carnosus]|uniref:Alpha-type protein kinase domain-containing protein n=1 Tax=Didymodactylos carnosus TaxID=1234261 RepID=A0A815YNS4_9BILA|nr:unnamed protein product [Didymodactylos carnosus]CAF4435646.1 unnamed protein product [Didymodactylos carnosus]